MEERPQPLVPNNLMVHKETEYPMLLAQETCVTNLDDLRDFVYHNLCNYDQLEPGVFTMTERILARNGEPCGMHFCLHGPRRVKYTSIWETDTNSILFYGPTGERFHKTQLIGAPELSATMPDATTE